MEGTSAECGRPPWDDSPAEECYDSRSQIEALTDVAGMSWLLLRSEVVLSSICASCTMGFFYRQGTAGSETSLAALCRRSPRC